MPRLSETSWRYLEASGFIVAWMAIGASLRVTERSQFVAINCYLLIGIPLTILFQRYVRRQPLVSLWCRDLEHFSIGPLGWLMAAGFAATPVYHLATSALPASSWVAVLWDGAAVAGALGAAFCLERTPVARLRKGMRSFLAACVLGVIIIGLAALAGGKSPLPTLEQVPLLLQQFLLYFAVCFSLEEVVFRGLLDTHLQPQPVSGLRAWPSALAVSFLWGLWHLPLVPFPNLLAVLLAAPFICIVHVLIGVPLSFCWRSTGSLLLPCAAHALIDAIRNVILMS
jgi:membrane protease YdiL (CAAX protease family)